MYKRQLIDRANEDKETAVHFLNQVDEADLMALMEDEQTTQEQPATCTCTEKCVAGAVNTACPVCATNMNGCTGKEPPEPETCLLYTSHVYDAGHAALLHAGDV